MEIRMPHTLDVSEASQRLVRAVERHDIELKEGSTETSGTMAKSTPMGAVEVSYEVSATEVVVRIVKKPIFLTESVLRRPLEDAMREALAR